MAIHKISVHHIKGPVWENSGINFEEKDVNTALDKMLEYVNEIEWLHT